MNHSQRPDQPPDSAAQPAEKKAKPGIGWYLLLLGLLLVSIVFFSGDRQNGSYTIAVLLSPLIIFVCIPFLQFMLRVLWQLWRGRRPVRRAMTVNRGLRYHWQVYLVLLAVSLLAVWRGWAEVYIQLSLWMLGVCALFFAALLLLSGYNQDKALQHLNNCEPEKAAAGYEQKCEALRCKPDNPQKRHKLAYYTNNLAICHRDMGDTSLAMHLLNTLDYDPGDLLTAFIRSYNLACFYFDLDKEKDFRAEQERAMEVLGPLSPQEAATYQGLVEELKALQAWFDGDLEQTAAYYTQLLTTQLPPRNQVYVHFTLARIYERQGNAKKQRKHLARAAELGRDTDRAVRARQALRNLPGGMETSAGQRG